MGNDVDRLKFDCRVFWMLGLVGVVFGLFILGLLVMEWYDYICCVLESKYYW